MFSGYDFCMFEDVFHQRTVDNLEAPLEERLFYAAGYVKARGMSCKHLGRSIGEVLATLLCAMAGTTYCPSKCGCALEAQLTLLSGTTSPA